MATLATFAYLIFVEDKINLLWQLELTLYSMTHNAGVKADDIFVYWADPSYYEDPKKYGNPATVDMSPYLSDLKKTYPTMKFYYSQNFGRQNRNFRFTKRGWSGVDYPGINKWSSWIEWWNSCVFCKYDYIYILEQDLWFSGPFHHLAGENSVSYNYIPTRKELFKRSNNLTDWGRDRGFVDGNHPGYDLDVIMTLTGVTNLDLWVPGAVIFKFKVADLTTALVNDIMNYQYFLLDLGEISHPNGKFHETDMIAPCLALARNNVSVTLDRSMQWFTSNWVNAANYENGQLVQSGVVHYGWNFRGYKFLGTQNEGLQWCKCDYVSTTPWSSETWRQHYTDLIVNSTYSWTKKMFTDIMTLGDIALNRTCTKSVKKIRV